MPYYEIFNQYDKPESMPVHDSLLSREDQLRVINKRMRFDVAIVGGGIHGATLARLAAFNGLRVVLLERGDYACETSGSSSKMAHGGLRYLELLDFKQVREGVVAREELLSAAPHLVKAQPFIIPVFKGQWFLKHKLSAGLWLYDRFMKKRSYNHTWLSKNQVPWTQLCGWRERLNGAYQYHDGIMDDFRLVLETIHAARHEGAFCLNHSEVQEVKRHIGSVMSISWKDLQSGQDHECHAGVVVNCAGPWAPHIAKMANSSLFSKVRYSRGSHLIFRTPWQAPAICLPLKGRGRYYFVWPHPAGTMVGTTEREVERPESTPLPHADEIDELLDRVQKDLPGSGLDRSTLFWTFAGIRTLPVRSIRKGTAVLSRRHSWIYENGILSLIGGKFTTAGWTCQEGLDLIYGLAEQSSKPAHLRGRPLPGSIELESESKLFLQRALQAGVPGATAEGALRRHGARVRNFTEADPGLKLVAGTFLEAEIDWLLQHSQAENFTDLARRLQLESVEDYGLTALPELVKTAERARPQIAWADQTQRYSDRVTAVKQLLGI
ncbi:MAG: FAD-dependent oxidoreductase [Deltaproteobacteria bacterium]|nr:FAD-dependent oxidoreductase [Deltaproteobacteria bacterium]